MTDGWRELYETEYPRLLRALLPICGDPDAAEDAVQEAFVKAHRTGLDRLERPGAWLLVVGTRELFRSRRRRHVEDQKWVERGPADVPGTDAVADRADLLSALRQPPARQRTVVVPRDYYRLADASSGGDRHAEPHAVGEHWTAARHARPRSDLRRADRTAPGRLPRPHSFSGSDEGGPHRRARHEPARAPT